jgi:DNA invertase Pin-like site-specific DNA recombinase
MTAARRRTIPATDSTKAIAYLRASTTKQELSPAAQRKMVAEWAKANRVEVVEEHHDLGVCGATEIPDRPGLVAALAALHEHRAGVPLVARRDRLGRSVETLVLVEREVARLGAKVVTADGANGDDAHDKFLRRILDAVAEHELAIIRARTKAALAVRRDRGLRCGNVPLGQRLGEDGETLLPDLGERRAAALARRLRDEGLSLRDVAERLDEATHATRTGARWHHEQVRRLLSLSRRGRR